MQDKEYSCGYKYCLHCGEKVKASESAVIGNKHYHWDCASVKQEINECANRYVKYSGKKEDFPAAVRIISVMIFKSRVPIEYISRSIDVNQYYYSRGLPPQVLYGIRKNFYEHEFIGK